MERAGVGEVHMAMMRMEQGHIVEPGDEGAHLVEAARGADILTFDRDARPPHRDAPGSADRNPDAAGDNRDVNFVRRGAAAPELDAVPDLPNSAGGPFGTR